jgi:hypothetical protein
VHSAIRPGYWRQHAYTRETDATREAPCVVECNDQPEAGDGWSGRTGGFCRDKDWRMIEADWLQGAPRLCGEGVEQLGWSFPFASVFHLAFVYRVHEFDTEEKDAGTAKVFEAEP